ncbi:MAG: hypothetical protein H6713_06270 [Myxococcales bacterium]|nr:hypothetical protein [Myxococcales bacterium]MCB9749598.1 hypothetical protein [Myxococcales bacterium]
MTADGTENAAALEVFGALLDGYAKACLNLNIVAGRRAASLTSAIEIPRWYPFQRLKDIESLVTGSYENVGPIMERVGYEMMMGWYHYGPGQQLIRTGVDFLRFQSGSEGYASVVKGPRELVGSFSLLEVDPARGRALVHSTTPLDRDMERGVLIGGMSAPGDLDYVDVTNAGARDRFEIEFH